MKKVLSIAMASLFFAGATFANMDGGKGCCAKKAGDAKCEKTAQKAEVKNGTETYTITSVSANPGAATTVAKEACKGTKTDCAAKEAKGACCSKGSAKASTKEVKADKEVSIN